MKIIVVIPSALRGYIGDVRQVDLEASTIEEVLRKLNERFPGLADLLVSENGRLRRYVNVFVNKDDIRFGGGLETKLKDGDQVRIIPAIAGG